jgi:hypothetical protein
VIAKEMTPLMITEMARLNALAVKPGINDGASEAITYGTRGANTAAPAIEQTKKPTNVHS